MIYVSSSCVKHKKIKDSVQELVDSGFRNIELSGGTDFYLAFENDLLELQDKYRLNYICHNYFPPPKEHFVLNLASFDNNIFNRSLNHFKNSIDLSKRLGAKSFGLHAGFFIDISVNEIGKKISSIKVLNKNKSIIRFCEGYDFLLKYAEGLELFIENNVLSEENFENYKTNIFMLTSVNEYKDLKKQINFNLLLDVAHLKVSSNTLKLGFDKEFRFLVNESKYIHISDNDSFSDLNNVLKKGSHIYTLLKEQELKKKIVTLEIYDDIDSIKQCYELLQSIV